MNAAPFCAKQAGGPRARVVPLDSDDSCLGDSGDSDEECTSKAGLEKSSSERTEDRSSSTDEEADGPPRAPPSAADTRGRAAAAAQRKGRKVAWKTIEQQNSATEVPVWQDALPDSETIRLPVQYVQDFFDGELLDKTVEHSNLYCSQIKPKWCPPFGPE